MSNCSYTDTCPNCKGEMDSYEKTRPYNTIEGCCMHCGFYYEAVSGQLDLGHINELRRDHNDNVDDGCDGKKVEMLDKLPEFDKALVWPPKLEEVVDESKV